MKVNIFYLKRDIKQNLKKKFYSKKVADFYKEILAKDGIDNESFKNKIK